MLNIDPGSKTSGWSIWVSGLYYASGECRLSIFALQEVIGRAHRMAKGAGLPCLLVTERPFIQKRGRSHGASDHAHKLWRDVWVDLGGVQKRVLRVWPAVWRPPVLGRGTGNMERDDVRLIEQQVALNLVTNHGYNPAPEGLVIGPDEAPAIGIGRWSSCAGEVGASLPAKLRRVA